MRTLCLLIPVVAAAGLTACSDASVLGTSSATATGAASTSSSASSGGGSGSSTGGDASSGGSSASSSSGATSSSSGASSSSSSSSASSSSSGTSSSSSSSASSSSSSSASSSSGGGSTTGATQDPPAIGAADAPPGYQLAWADEFDGTSVDTSKWTAMNDSNYGSGNHEDECYFAANATEAGGQVSLTAQRQTVQCGGTNPDTGDHTYDFTSAFLTTRGGGPGGGDKYAFTYGYAEARIQMPKGNPYWGAFWLVGASGGPAWPDYGEFDVTELVGGYPDLTYGTFHYACAGHTNCQTSPHIYNLDTESAYGGSSNNGTQLTPSNFASYTGQTSSRFVRYGFLWEPGRITWYVDGRPVRSFDGTHLVRYATDADGIIASTTVEKTVGTDLTAPSIPFATVFANPHTIDLNLAFGGAFPQGDGYTGGETATGYDDGNLAAELPGAMSVDYVRVFQL